MNIIKILNKYYFGFKDVEKLQYFLQPIKPINNNFENNEDIFLLKPYIRRICIFYISFQFFLI